jgi:hypothetical protein
MRPICQICGRNPAAVNGYHNGKRYYRSRCNSCIKKGRSKAPLTPRWKSAGYKKKMACDRCKFRARSSAQLQVYHVDGDLRNCDLHNLKTVCLNCGVELERLDLPWRVGDLEEDR